MLPIHNDVLKQYEAVLKKRAVPDSHHADWITGSDSGIILIFVENICFRILSLNMCVYSSKSCEKRNNPIAKSNIDYAITE